MVAISDEVRYFLTALLLVVGGILPIVNPIGSAPMFLAMTHGADPQTRAVLAAACAATRAQPEAIQRRTRTRRLFLQLARDQGWRNPHDLATLCGISPRTVRWYFDAPIDEPGLHAALACLGDPRLRSYLDEAVHRFLANVVPRAAG